MAAACWLVRYASLIDALLIDALLIAALQFEVRDLCDNSLSDRVIGFRYRYLFHAAVRK